SALRDAEATKTAFDAVNLLGTPCEFEHELARKLESERSFGCTASFGCKPKEQTRVARLGTRDRLRRPSLAWLHCRRTVPLPGVGFGDRERGERVRAGFDLLAHTERAHAVVEDLGSDADNGSRQRQGMSCGARLRQSCFDKPQPGLGIRR